MAIREGSGRHGNRCAAHGWLASKTQCCALFWSTERNPMTTSGVGAHLNCFSLPTPKQ